MEQTNNSRMMRNIEWIRKSTERPAVYIKSVWWKNLYCYKILSHGTESAVVILNRGSVEKRSRYM